MKNAVFVRKANTLQWKIPQNIQSRGYEELLFNITGFVALD